MQRKNMTNRIIRRRSGRKNHGFTLLELVVVLIIITILAAVGIATAIGYIKKSRFEQNSQNAVSIYQAAQTALSAKVANGTHDSWTYNLVEMKISQEARKEFEKDLDTDNESNTMTLALTFNPGSSSATEDSYLYNLLSDQFYDKTIFAGTMAVEFNIVATYSKGMIYYSSWVASAFYCRQNDVTTGWSSDCIGNAQDGLPQRNPYEYRRDVSLVGWYDGTPDSVTGPDGVCPVQIPQSISKEMDGHILADSTEEGFLFNLRNGETLDVSWAIFDDYIDADKLNSDSHYYEDHNEDLIITLITESSDDSMYGNAEEYAPVRIIIKDDQLQDFRRLVSNQTETIVRESFNDKNRTSISRYTRTGTITTTVYIGTEEKVLTFPLAISKVIGDTRKGCPDAEIGYYEYRLSLDCMLIRSVENEEVESRFNAERLFGTTPRNISAILSGSFDRTKDSETVEKKTVPTNIQKPVYAARAIDDPVYFTGVGKNTEGNTAYWYDVVEEAARFDGKDNGEEGTTGKCVVNTLFGDLSYNDAADGTYWSKDNSGKYIGDAVITSFRHLYNIRWISSGTVNYRIARNLDWYTNKPGFLIVSDVRVYQLDGKYFTPASVTNADDVDSSLLKIVSFPALNELKAGQTLTSVSDDASKKIVSINNLQMRTSSFTDGTDKGYGLICTNNGTIYNIYTDNLNLILAPVADGSKCDYDLISKSEVTIGTESTSELNANYFVGGLVGVNHGNIGKSDAQINENVIMMSNSIVMASPETDNYWLSSNYEGVAGIVGKNEKNDNYSPVVCGKIEINGGFAVVGNNNVGAAIAYTNGDIGARIVVDGREHGNSEFDLPAETSTDSAENLSCVISGINNVGGAIGFMDSCELNCTVTEITEEDVTYDDDTGKVTFEERSKNDYQIYVYLPENSLVLELDNGLDGCCVGGAIGYMSGCDGVYMSLFVNNQGNILIKNKDSKVNEVGGVIGYDNGSTTTSTYISAFNGSGVIGSFLDTNNKPKNNAEHCGGVYGLLDTPNGRTIYIDVVNDGTKISATSDDNGDNQGAGGAIGAIMNGNVTIIANVENNAGSKILYSSKNYKKNTGVGGAIGVIQNSDTTYLSGDSHIYAENSGYIHADYNVGGAVGVMSVNHGDIYSYNKAEITGNYCIGGAVGWSREAEDGTIQAVLVGSTISGQELIGGAVGRLPDLQGGTIKTKVYGSSTVSGTGSVVGGVCGDVCVQGNGTGNLVLDGNGSKLTVGTSGKGVGGVAGVLRANIVNYVTVKATNVVLDISGSESVGGAIGRLRSTKWENSDTANPETDPLVSGTDNKTGVDIMVSVDVVLPSSSKIVGDGSDVGGAIGFVHTNQGKFGGAIRVSSESGSSEDIIIRGTANVGGAVGHFGSLYPDKVSDNSRIDVDFTSSPAIIESTVSASSDANLGGAVGFFDSNSLGNPECKYIIVADLGNSSLSAKGSNVGGAIGNSTIKNGDITVSLSGTITGNNNVGGGIGRNTVNISSIDVTATGDEKSWIKGSGNYVGGAVGYNNTANATITNVSSELTGGISVSGSDYVGGCIGLDEANIGEMVSSKILAGSSVVGKHYVGGTIGRIANNAITISNVSVKIDDGGFVSGTQYLGGAIGSMGTDKNSVTITTISTEINTGIPVVQNEGISTTDDACIGGAVGIVFSGTINTINLKGSGGSVNLQTDLPGVETPNCNLSDGLLIAGSGRSIGGIIGSLGERLKERTVNIVSINVDPNNAPAFVVVSKNGSQGIGGWIGSCYSKAVIGTSTSSMSNLSIKSVKVVYSRGECVGGFIGYTGYTKAGMTTKINIYANIDMVLSSAYICGLARTGGVYGDSHGVVHYGICNLEICNNTSIGDFKGDAETDDITGCFCVEAGGFAGRVTNKSAFKDTAPICEITITIDETSRIFAGGTSLAGAPEGSEIKLEDAGVGGAIGRLGAAGQGTNPTSVTNTTAETYKDHFVKTFGVISSSSKPTVFSAYAHAGGAIGHALSSGLSRCFSTACVKQIGPGCTGGFVGKMDAGSKFANCYAGGHTFGGQYVPDEENVVGTQYVGGFAGYIGNINQIYQSYSTCSVRSTYTGGKNVYLGGFIGGAENTGNDKLKYTYCTGLVTAPNNVLVDGLVPDDGSVYVGAYAGYLPSYKVCSAGKDNGEESGRALMYINQYSHMGRVGNINEDLFYDGEFIPSTNANNQAGCKNRNDYSKRILLARWGSWGTNWYIRHKKDSTYYAWPFDSYLEENTETNDYFPLRTFISYKVSDSKWVGEHWGDWPVFPEDKIILDNDNTVITITLPQEGIVYNGSQVTIEDYLKVTYNGEPLKKDINYALKYTDNDKIGTATIRITGIGDYYGSFIRQFEIVQADISDQNAFTIGIAPTAPYADDAEVKPEVTVLYRYKDNTTTLVENKDYTLLYENNTQPGEATVKITGIGNYKGEVTKTFTILALYYIDFETSGGTAIPRQRIIDGGTATKPQTDPTLTGHTFGGWYADKDCETVYDFSTPVSDDITIYAKWIPDKFVVQFEVNGGVSVDAQTVEYGKKINTDVMPEQNKDGYTFICWCTDEECTTEFDLDTAIRDNLTLYVLWKKNPTVTFETNGGSTIDAITMLYNTSVSEPEKPTKDHFTFLGWYKDAEFEDEYKFNASVTEDITLYAKWGANPIVTFESNGGTAVDSIEIPYNSKVTEPKNMTKEGGFRFDAWYADEELNDAFDFNKEITEDVTVYAGWVKTYIITYVIDGVETSKEYDSGISLKLDTPTKDGWKFAGWFIDPYFTNKIDGDTLDVDSNKTIYAKFEEDESTPDPTP